MSLTPLQYCQYLLCSPFNHTRTYFADHYQALSHDPINRALRQMEVTTRDMWREAQKTLVSSANGYLLFDDTVVYVNPATNPFWAIDYRVYQPEVDVKSKLDHVQEMLKTCMEEKEGPFSTVLIDSPVCGSPLRGDW